MYSVLFSAMNMLMVWRYIKTVYNKNNNNKKVLIFRHEVLYFQDTMNLFTTYIY